MGQANYAGVGGRTTYVISTSGEIQDPLPDLTNYFKLRQCLARKPSVRAVTGLVGVALMSVVAGVRNSVDRKFDEKLNFPSQSCTIYCSYSLYKLSTYMRFP